MGREKYYRNQSVSNIRRYMSKIAHADCCLRWRNLGHIPARSGKMLNIYRYISLLRLSFSGFVLSSIARPRVVSTLPRWVSGSWNVQFWHKHNEDQRSLTAYAVTSAFCANSLRRRFFCKPTAHCNESRLVDLLEFRAFAVAAARLRNFFSADCGLCCNCQQLQEAFEDPSIPLFLPFLWVSIQTIILGQPRRCVLAVFFNLRHCKSVV